MPVNPYFNKFNNSPEQSLVDSIVTEVIKIHGMDVAYIPRAVVNKDDLFGEDRLARFKDGFLIEAYLDSYEGFEGEGEVMTQFGLDIKDEIELTVSRSRFNSIFPEYPYPREGDLIYLPLSDGLFEINFVEREKNFFHFGKIFSYTLKCSMFKYSGEDITTGFGAIDGATSDVNNRLIVVTTSSGSGEFIEGERAHLYDALGSTGATLDVINWNTSTDTAEVMMIGGTFGGAASIIGANSGATYSIDTIGFTNDFFVQEQFEDNTNFMLEGNSFIDFTDTDPFSEGDL